MSPILGIYASQISGHLSNFYSIATQTVGAGGASSITFLSIPSTYTHLQIRSINRDTSSLTTTGWSHAIFNSDTGSNYFRHWLYGNGSTVTAASDSAAINGGVPVASSVTGGSISNAFAGSVTDILDYANTNKYKTVRHLGGLDVNASGDYRISLISGLWMSTAAITSITINPSNNNFAQGATFALYGVK